MKMLIILGLSLFTIIQPLAFWINARKAIDPNMPETEISFEENDMVIKVNNHIQRIAYANIVKVISKPELLIVQPDQKHIYILPKRILDNNKKELFQYLKSKIV